jgi:hypothetical protein
MALARIHARLNGPTSKQSMSCSATPPTWRVSRGRVEAHERVGVNTLRPVGDHRCREVGCDAIEQRGPGRIGATKGIGLTVAPNAQANGLVRGQIEPPPSVGQPAALDGARNGAVLTTEGHRESQGPGCIARDGHQHAGPEAGKGDATAKGLPSRALG